VRTDEVELMARLWSPSIKDDPLAFVLLAFPWGEQGTPLEKHAGPRKWQRAILQAIKDHIKENDGKIDFDTFRMAVASGRGIGKSALVSWLVIWMMSTRIGGSVIVSANSEAQLRSVTWAEITKWLAMTLNSHWFEIAATRIMPAKWLTEIVEREMKKGTRYWSVEGRLWSEENPDAYAGLHNEDGVMLIFDEASGIPDSIWSVSDGFFTENTPHRFHLAFSNPRRNTGYFYETFHSKRAFWRTRTIDARDVEGTDKNLYQRIIDEYGPESYQASVEVYGNFPSEGDDQFIASNLVDDAMKRPPIKDDSAPDRHRRRPCTLWCRRHRHRYPPRVVTYWSCGVTAARTLLEVRRAMSSTAIEQFKPALVCIGRGRARRRRRRPAERAAVQDTRRELRQ